MRRLKPLFNFWRSSVLPWMVAIFGQGLLKLILKTCSIEVKGLDRFLKTAQEKGTILALWHNQIAPVAEILCTYAPELRYVCLVSNSRDGKLLKAVVKMRGHETTAVHHEMRHQGLRTIASHLKEHKTIIVTPDGPKGPIHKVKPGVAFLGAKCEAPIVPLSWSAKRYWFLRTWDRMRIPKPFSTIEVAFGPPLQIARKQPLKEQVVAIEKAIPSH